MQSAPQVLRARELQARGLGIDARKILCGDIAYEYVGHAIMISGDIDSSSAKAKRPPARSPKGLAFRSLGSIGQ